MIQSGAGLTLDNPVSCGPPPHEQKPTPSSTILQAPPERPQTDVQAIITRVFFVPCYSEARIRSLAPGLAHHSHPIATYRVHHNQPLLSLHNLPVVFSRSPAVVPPIHSSPNNPRPDLDRPPLISCGQACSRRPIRTRISPTHPSFSPTPRALHKNALEVAWKAPWRSMTV